MATPTTAATFTIRSLGPDIPYDVRSSLQSVAQQINVLQGAIDQLRQSITDLTNAPLTSAQLQQVNAALSAAGAVPLNVTGLVGTTTATP